MIRDGVRRVLHLALRRRDRWEREVEEEIKLHLALRAEQLMARGDDADAAYAEAVRRFGPLHESRARLFDEARHREVRMQRSEWLSDLRQDLTFAWRGLRRQKAWTAITVLTLALGIGATTAVFSVLSTLVLHPLPYPDADRIVVVNQQPSEGNHTGIQVTISPAAPVVRAWRANSRAFEALEVQSGFGWKTLATESGEQSSLSTASILPSLADFTGDRPLLGRMFSQADIDAGGHVLVLSEGFWRGRLGARTDILGKRLTIADSVYEIIGVMPSHFRFGRPTTRAADAYLPIDMHNDRVGMSVLGRLRRGATIAQAQGELDSIFARTSGFGDGKAPFRALVQTPGERLDFRDALIMLTAAVALVLLVACANVAHLVLVRTSARQRELAIRAALGAGRGRLARQLLAESVVLSGVGAALGLAFGWLFLRGFIAARPATLDVLSGAHLDASTTLLAIGVCIGCAILFAVAGAFARPRAARYDALRVGSPSSGGSGPRSLRRGLLVITEMAISATLLVGATLMIRSLVGMTNADLGYEPRGLYYLTIPFPKGWTTSADQRASAAADFMARVRTLPGVTSVSAADVEPGGRSFSIGRLEISGEAPPPAGTSSFIDVNTVEPTYFATMGIRLRAGRLFADRGSGMGEVIVNEGFAKQHWPSGGALGARIRVAQSGNEPWLTIVGVVNDAATSGPMAEAGGPILYQSMIEMSTYPKILVRTGGDATSLAPTTTFLKQMGIVRTNSVMQSVEQTMGQTIATPRYVTMLLAIFTSLAVLLSAIGLYGVMSYAVAQETRAIGIRIALGASRLRIARSVIVRGTALASIGALIGLVIARWSTRLIESQLYHVAPLDPASYAIGGALLILTGLVACAVPTRRALAVDPMTAIRAD